jgi:hypothetical protein
LTCYFRHLQEVFAKAGIEVTKENRNELDVIIHKIIRVEHKNCPATWKEVKRKLDEDEAGFISRLKTEWNTRG